MALPKKGSRKIIVDGHSYIWIITKNDTVTTLTIASAEINGQTMIACFDRFIKSSEGKEYFVITPYIVRQSILYGLENNWKPHVSGGQIHLKNLTTELDLSSTGSRKTKKLIKLLRTENDSKKTKNEKLELDLLQCEEFLKYGEWFVGLEFLISNELSNNDFKMTDEMFILIDEIIRAASDNLKESKIELTQSVNKLKRATKKV